MSPIDYLRGMVKRGRKPATGGLVQPDPTLVAALFAQANDRPQHMATEYKAGARPTKRTTAPAPKPLPKLDWTNPVRTVGACTHDVIYSRCTCPATNISTETTAADFPADQQR